MKRKLTQAEKTVIKVALEKNHPNLFLDYFLCGTETGTWWRPVREVDISRLTYPPFIRNARRLRDGYNAILEIWNSLGKPNYFIEQDYGDWKACDEKTYNAHFVYDLKRFRVVKYPHEIIFHHRHGYRMPDWYLNIIASEKETRILIGGFGSGKTMNAVAENLYYAATLPEYRAAFLAPYDIQAQEAFTIANNLISGTPYADCFIERTNTKPLQWMMGSSEIGWNNKIIGLSVLRDSHKLLTMTLDAGLVDQAEGIANLDGLLADLSTRFRGQVKGRQRIGKSTLLANAKDNQNLWELHEQGESGDPTILVYSPETGDNFYLTVRDMLRYEARAGRTPQERLVAFAGAKPRMGGEQFPATTLAIMVDAELDEMGRKAASENDDKWNLREVDGIGHVIWERPRNPEGSYVVIADPGYDNPPYRNSPVVMCFDVSHFPFAPARLQAFYWVYGEHNPNPWINCFTDLVVRYDAYSNCGYDGTGAQSGYEKLNTGLSELGARPINFSGNKKFAYLNFFKKMAADGLVKVPRIHGIFSQVGGYRLPDTDQRQDIVACLFVLAAMLEDSYTEHLNEAEMKLAGTSDYGDPRTRALLRRQRSQPQRSRSEGYRYEYPENTNRY